MIKRNNQNHLAPRTKIRKMKHQNRIINRSRRNNNLMMIKIKNAKMTIRRRITIRVNLSD